MTTTVDMRTSVGGVGFASCLMNASGPCCTTLEELRNLGHCKAAGIVTKSCTLLPREGNDEPRYCDLPHGAAMQAMGLPNLGFKTYAEFVPLLKGEFPDKPVVVSVAGLCVADNAEILLTIDRANPDLIELNLSCPNIVGKPQVGYDFEQTEDVLSTCCERLDTPLGLKLPPYFDGSHHDEMASIVKAHNSVKFLTCVNSVGNTLAIDADSEKPLIRPKGGFGGLSGTYVKPVGLANVNAFHRRLPQCVDIIGVGGIATGTDAFEYLLAGASAMQIGTQLWREGCECFDRIEQELIDLLDRKGYKSISDVIGKLKQF